MQLLKQLIHYATLAPSSHNTQCWKFHIDEQDGSHHSHITILPDFARRCPIVDPDDHHLYVSLGCAVENLAIAAEAYGFSTRVDARTPETGIRISLKRETKHEDDEVPKHSPLFDAIQIRQSNRGMYDGQKVSPEDLRTLHDAGQGNGVRMLTFTDTDGKESIKNFVCQANCIQLQDTAFRKELKEWVRFNEKEAKTSGDGLYGKCMGHPSAPRWFGGLIFDFGVTEEKENQKIRDGIDSSAGIAVFVSERDDPVHWVEAGRSFERFALTAASLRIFNAHLNQPIEVKSVRQAFAKAMGLLNGSRPDLILRFGRGTPMPKSLRRPIEDVLEEP